ncbi:hypothetical protein D3C71_1519830 [compost metagenome]
MAAVAAGHPEPDRRLGRVPRARQGRPVPRRGVRVHAPRQDHLAASRRHAGGFRLRHPYRYRQPGGRGQGQRRIRAPAHRTQQRRHGRDRDLSGFPAQRAVAQLCAHRPRALRDPALPAYRQVRRIRGIRRTPAGPGAARAAHAPARHRRPGLAETGAQHRRQLARGNPGRHRAGQASGRGCRAPLRPGTPTGGHHRRRGG